ncbi:hypothetical protein AGOR_G00037000 [Albula goreensis]|uniref:Protein LYRIC n=1 Tax=Albula goreensis TaxID=1534307 RepID=A0A8T3DXJ6_9TELE|nr:hypothetical protein AGOR_G00037000 [Albula goreensis]
MAKSWQDVATQQAELISSRLRELLSSGLGLLRSELGVDLEEKEQKKPIEKKTQPNGRTVPELQEEDKVTEEIPKPSPEIKAEKTKKNKKKPKTEVKQAQIISSPDGKEPDEGAWETKISNREKRQQRRKDKVPGDGSGSPGGVDSSRPPVDPPSATAPVALRKSRGEPPLKPGKGDSIISQVSANWSETPAMNGGGLPDMARKIPSQMSSLDGEKWSNIMKETPHAWGQETEGSWSGLDGRLKTDLNPVSLPLIGLNSAGEPVSQSTVDIQCHSQPAVDDEWSGFNGMEALDPSSDWNPPAELWGNYEDPQLEAPAPPNEPISEAVKASDDEKEKGDASTAVSGKSKKKKKKKKKQEDAGAALQESEEVEREAAADVEVLRQPVQESGTPTAVEERMSVQEKPSSQVPQRVVEPETLLPSPKQNSTPAPSQKKTEENWESPKQIQKKKKARRET